MPGPACSSTPTACARACLTNQRTQVTGFYELLQEFSIQAPAEDLAAAACVDADYAALRDTAWAAEAAKERHAEEFRCVGWRDRDCAAVDAGTDFV